MSTFSLILAQLQTTTSQPLPPFFPRGLFPDPSRERRFKRLPTPLGPEKGFSMASPQPRPGILDIAPYVGGGSALPGIEAPAKLSSNESPLGPSPQAISTYREVAEKMFRYPETDSGTLRGALGRHWALDPGGIVCGNGSDELLTLLTLAYAGPGDEVLFAEHSFAVYEIVSRFAGATPVSAPEKNLKVDVDALLERVSKKTRIVFLTNPGNPTGGYIPTSEMDRLHRGLREDILLVIDSAYAEFVKEDDFSAGAELVENNKNVVMSRTFSKIYGLAGLRLGWIYAPAEVVDVLNRVRGPFNVTLPAQAAGIAALADTAYTEKVRLHNEKWRGWITGELEEAGLTIFPSVTNFILVRFPDAPEHNAAAADAFLKGHGILIRRVENYGLPGYLRISIGTEKEMRHLSRCLKEFMGSS